MNYLLFIYLFLFLMLALSGLLGATLVILNPTFTLLLASFWSPEKSIQLFTC